MAASWVANPEMYEINKVSGVHILWLINSATASTAAKGGGAKSVRPIPLGVSDLVQRG